MHSPLNVVFRVGTHSCLILLPEYFSSTCTQQFTLWGVWAPILSRHFALPVQFAIDERVTDKNRGINTRVERTDKPTGKIIAPGYNRPTAWVVLRFWMIFI